MPFADILGQEKATSYLSHLVQTQKVPGALLFYGPDGVGKAATALEWAKALNCTDPQARQTGDACGVCASCRALDRGTHPDVLLVDFAYQAQLEIKKDASSKGYEEELEKEIAKQQHLNVNTIRHITAKSQQKSMNGGWKVMIIREAQSMQPAAANALLKFIEEPPAKTVWVLITNKRAAMLRTILSRCQPLAFAPLKEAHVRQILIQKHIDTGDPDTAARYSGGSVSGACRADAALTLLREAGLTENASLGTGIALPAAAAAGLSRTLATARQEAQAVLDVFITALHRAWTQQQSEAGQRRYQAALKQFETYKRNISRNVSPALVLETALMSVDQLQIPIL